MNRIIFRNVAVKREVSTTGRTLILSVDRDDDIGWKAHIESPAIGRAACLKAANTLALADPEDSDVNAIFSAIKIYDELTEKGEETAIAVVAGNHLHMIEGDRRIATSLEQVIQETKATSCILVTDGAEDEYVIPIIQSKIPVSSIRRVIVNQMPNLEGTYYILKKFFDDPKISRMIFIPLGLAMILYATAYLLDYPGVATIIVVGVIGGYLLYKGFGFDEIVHSIMDLLRVSLSRGRFSFVTYTTTILLIIIGFTVGFINVLKFYSTDGSLGLLLYLMTFIYGSVGWFIVAGLVTSIGVIIDVYTNEREGLGKVIVFPFFVVALGFIFYGASVFIISVSAVPDFPLTGEDASKYILYSTIIGIISAIAGVITQYVVNRKMAELRKQEIIEVM
jgi:putative membrane protein